MQILNISDSLARGFLEPITQIGVIISQFVGAEDFLDIEGNIPDNAEFKAVVSIMLLVLFLGLLVAALTVLAVSMIARAVILMILVVVSPVTFLLMILPGSPTGLAVKWWKTFISMALWGPAGAMFVWLALITMTADSPLALTFESNNQPILEGFRVTIGSLSKFVVASVFLFAAIVAGKVLSGQAGAASVKFGKALGKVAANATGASGAYKGLKAGVAAGAKRRNERNEERFAARTQDAISTTGNALRRYSGADAASDFLAGRKGDAKKSRKSIRSTSARDKAQAKRIAKNYEDIKKLDGTDLKKREASLGTSADDKEMRMAILRHRSQNGTLEDGGVDPNKIEESLSGMGFDPTERKRVGEMITHNSLNSKDGDARYAAYRAGNLASEDSLAGGFDGSVGPEAFAQAAAQKQNTGDSHLRSASKKIFRGDDEKVKNNMETEANFLAGIEVGTNDKGEEKSLRSSIGTNAAKNLANDSRHDDLRQQVEKRMSGADGDPANTTFKVDGNEMRFGSAEDMQNYARVYDNVKNGPKKAAEPPASTPASEPTPASTPPRSDSSGDREIDPSAIGGPGGGS